MYCQENCCTARTGCSCAKGAVAFLLFLIALGVGLILGAVFYETILPVLAAVIAFVAALAAIVIAVLLVCCRRRGC